MKKTQVVIIVLVCVVLLSGCMPPTGDDSNSKAKTAYRECVKKAEECTKAPRVRAEYTNACWKIYYNTGDAEEIYDFMEGICEERTR